MASSNRLLLPPKQLQETRVILKHYTHILDATTDMITYLDNNYIYLAANKAYLTFHNKKEEELIGKNTQEIIGKENFKRIKPHLDRALKGESFTIKGHYHLPNKKNLIYEEGNFSPYQESTGKATGVVIAIRDTTKQELATQQALLAYKQAQHYFDIVAVMIVALDKEANIIRINQKGCEILGYTKEEPIGKNWIDICIPQILRDEIHTIFSQVMQNKLDYPTHHNHKIITKDGSQRVISWHNVLVQDEEGNTIEILSSGEDITKLKESEERIVYQSLHDTLTDIPNRLMLSDRIEHAVELAKLSDKKIAVLFLDLDNFKMINESYGHDVGDTILIEAVKRLKETLKPTNTLARFGGDEFVIVSEHLDDISHAANLALTVLRKFHQPFIIKDESHFISASIGISIFPDDGIGSKSLIKAADTAMYRAKQEGKNQYAFYTEELTTILFEKMMLENSLRKAIKNEEFELYYQPQYTLKENKIIGFEALVRWNHPDLGLISPIKFIPIAESSRLIIPLGSWILNQACTQVKKWHQEGIYDGKIAVNVSGIQMEHSDFLTTLYIALDDSQLDPSFLEIEITESVLMKNPKRWIKILQEVKKLGVCIAIDDFGTGYSSLAYLRHLPLDKLKIDKSFIDDIPQDNDACAIAKAVIALAKSLGLTTLAEGIETKQQAAYLLNLKCDYTQGYLYNKALNTKDAETKLQQLL